MFFRTFPYEPVSTLSDLTRKRSRQRLKIRREPYWHRIETGAYLGFRRGPDTWIARFRNRDGEQKYEALAGAVDYDDAKRRAEEWFKQMGSAAIRKAKRGTVREALEEYLKYLREHGREQTATNAEQRFKQIVWDDLLAEVPLRRLTREDMREWRERLREGRQPHSIDRHVRSVVAGLNRAYTEGFVGKPEAWKLEPLDTDGGGETAVFLTSSQRQGIIKSASKEGAAFFRGLELTGARPKELAAATAGDFNRKTGQLKLSHRKGRPPKLRTRMVVLSDPGIAFFAELAKDKLPTAPLLVDTERKPWERHAWASEIRTAIKAHNATAKGKKRVPTEASAYSFRHARISELLQVHGVDPLTVALQTGTSLRMIERTYYHSIAPALRDKLSKIEGS